MRIRTRLPQLVLTSAMAGFVVAAAGSAMAAKKHSPAQQQAAAASAKKASDAEQAAAARKRVVEANEAIRAAQQAVDDAAKALKTQENEIIDAQSADSDFGTARDAYRAAEAKYQDARKSVLESDDFKAKLEAARDSDESATAVLALKKEFDQMPEIAGSRSQLQESKETYQPLRTKLLEADSQWVEADKDLQAKQKAVDDLKRQFVEANAAANKAKADAKKAAAAAAAAAQNAAQQPAKSKHR